MSDSYILAIDQGTSGTKTVIFNSQGEIIAKAAQPLKSYFLPGQILKVFSSFMRAGKRPYKHLSEFVRDD